MIGNLTDTFAMGYGKGVFFISTMLNPIDDGRIIVEGIVNV